MDKSNIPIRLTRRGGTVDLAAAITRSGSKQTYFTFRYLADHDRLDQAYQAYAYFRWLDDLLDCASGTKQEKTVLIERQKKLLELLYCGEAPVNVCTEEQILVDLISSDPAENSGLQIYLRKMMQVMAFDVQRCGRLITRAELSEYTLLLSTAVTELMFYLFGHRDHLPKTETRYHAVQAAHIVHLLRDTVQDLASGYINLPAELIEAGKIDPGQVDSKQFRKWVFNRVRLARKYFQSGRKYIGQSKSFRCRLAGFAYIARFEWILKLIEKDRYILRSEYPERKSLTALLWIIWRVLSSAINLPTFHSTERAYW